jgi:hypothetical protein
MMAGFNFEKNLDHQTQAVDSTMSVFKDLEILQSIGANKDRFKTLIHQIQFLTGIIPTISAQIYRLQITS